MLALPSKDTPPIVLAVANTVAVAALPDVSWLPDVLTPGKSMFELPLNETPPIVLAVAKIVDFGAVKVDASDKSVLAIVMFALPSKD